MDEKVLISLKEMLEAGELSQEAYDKIIALLTPVVDEEPKEEEKKPEVDKDTEEKALAEKLFGMKF